ncbi:MAG TPA: hypothetical protein VNS79_14720 [Sphingobium sp.]|nr:hypothetical protein [Sphingobium sp.]
MDEICKLLDDMVADPRHGWSIGTFGAIGEFMRDEDETTHCSHGDNIWTIFTGRGGMRIVPTDGLTAIAYDTLSSDGETWGQSVALCLPAPAQLDQGGVKALGVDSDALREEDREGELFDLGVGRGHIQFAVRTRDASLIAALRAVEGEDVFGPAGASVMAEILRAQPHRILLSPVGRIEVFSPIPAPNGKSPEGPHTHLLPKMLVAKRTHAANAPIPDKMQPVLMLHPRSPWRDALGQRVPFDNDLDDLFHDILVRFGLAQDLSVRAEVEEAVEAGVAPENFAWPTSRRARTAARITLRRLARNRAASVTAWRQRYDRGVESEPDEDAALHG